MSTDPTPNVVWFPNALGHLILEAEARGVPPSAMVEVLIVAVSFMSRAQSVEVKAGLVVSLARQLDANDVIVTIEERKTTTH